MFFEFVNTGIRTVFIFPQILYKHQVSMKLIFLLNCYHSNVLIALKPSFKKYIGFVKKTFPNVFMLHYRWQIGVLRAKKVCYYFIDRRVWTLSVECLTIYNQFPFHVIIMCCFAPRGSIVCSPGGSVISLNRISCWRQRVRIIWKIKCCF